MNFDLEYKFSPQYSQWIFLHRHYNNMKMAFVWKTLKKISRVVKMTSLVFNIDQNILVFPGLNYLFVFRHYQTFTENLLQSVLVDGFHVAFYELFNLIHSDNEYRKSLDPKSEVLKQKPLEEEYDKLELIAHYLKEAETANNNSKYNFFDSQENIL